MELWRDDERWIYIDVLVFARISCLGELVNVTSHVAYVIEKQTYNRRGLVSNQHLYNDDKDKTTISR